MHAELEDFLERAFRSIQRSSPNIGRVVVEPDYNSQLVKGVRIFITLFYYDVQQWDVHNYTEWGDN